MPGQQAGNTLSSSPPVGLLLRLQAPPNTQTSPCLRLLYFLVSLQAGGWQLSTDHSPWETPPRCRRLPTRGQLACILPVASPAGRVMIKLKMCIRLPMRMLLASALGTDSSPGSPSPPHARAVRLFRGGGPPMGVNHPRLLPSVVESTGPLQSSLKWTSPMRNCPGCQPMTSCPVWVCKNDITWLQTWWGRCGHL